MKSCNIHKTVMTQICEDHAFRYNEGNDLTASGIEGIESTIAEMNERKILLTEAVLKYRHEAMKINDMTGLFFATCQEVRFHLNYNSVGFTHTT